MELLKLLILLKGIYKGDIMKKKEIIELADKGLKSVPDIKRDIRIIDEELKKDTYTIADIEKLKIRRNRLHRKLSRTIEAISTLKEEEQKMICYRYFDKLNYKAIETMVGYSTKTIQRKIEKSKLAIGRIMFGFEDEFFRAIN